MDKIKTYSVCNSAFYFASFAKCKSTDRRAFFYLCIGAALTWSKIAGLAYSASLSEVLSAAMEGQNAIQSFELRCTFQDNTLANNSMPRQIWFRQMGDKFRVESKPLEEGDKTSLSYISAYDGKRFQQFYPHTSTLTFTKEDRFPTPYLELNPLCAPYFWLTDEPFPNWSVIRTSKRWSNIAESARLIGNEKVGANECVVAAITYPTLGEKAELRVYFAEKLGSYPIRIRSFPGQSRPKEKVELDVVDYKTVITDGRSVVVPTHVVMIEHGPDGNIANNLEWKVELESIKVNCTFPDDIFALSPSMAKVVDDYDYNKTRILRSGQDKSNGQVTRLVNQTRSWWLVGNIAAVFVLLIAVGWRRIWRRLVNAAESN